MSDYIIEIVKRLGIFLIASQTLLHFCPNKVYEKYIRILVGTMTITLISVPIIGMFKGDIESEIQAKMKKYEKDMSLYYKEQNINMEDAQINIEKMANSKMKTQLNIILGEYGMQIHKIKEKNNVLTVEVESVFGKKSSANLEDGKLKDILASYFQIEKERLEVRYSG